MVERLRHWLFRSRRKGCLWCEYWDICRREEK